MKKAGVMGAAAIAGFAAFAAPAAAHHSEPSCDSWSGAPVAEAGGASVEVESVRLWDVCPASPGVAVLLPDGRRVIVATDTPESRPAAAQQEAEPEPKPKKAKRCTKKQRKSRSKRSARRCRG